MTDKWISVASVVENNRAKTMWPIMDLFQNGLFMVICKSISVQKNNKRLCSQKHDTCFYEHGNYLGKGIS